MKCQSQFVSAGWQLCAASVYCCSNDCQLITGKANLLRQPSQWCGQGLSCCRCMAGDAPATATAAATRQAAGQQRWGLQVEQPQGLLLVPCGSPSSGSRRHCVLPTPCMVQRRPSMQGPGPAAHVHHPMRPHVHLDQPLQAACTGLHTPSDPEVHALGFRQHDPCMYRCILCAALAPTGGIYVCSGFVAAQWHSVLRRSGLCCVHA